MITQSLKVVSVQVNELFLKNWVTSLTDEDNTSNSCSRVPRFPQSTQLSVIAIWHVALQYAMTAQHRLEAFLSLSLSQILSVNLTLAHGTLHYDILYTNMIWQPFKAGINTVLEGAKLKFYHFKTWSVFAVSIKLWKVYVASGFDNLYSRCLLSYNSYVQY